MMIGLDMDGTIVDNNNYVPDQIKQELVLCHEAGIEMCFLTGRRPLTAKPHLDRIGIPALVATNSGCLLWEYPSWKSVERNLFPPELIQPVADLLAPYSANFYVDSRDTGFEFFYLDRQPSEILDTYLEKWGLKAKKISDPSEMRGYEITQVAMPAEDEIVDNLHEEVINRFNGNLLSLKVRWPLLGIKCLELFNPRANKGAALKLFSEIKGIDQERVMACGDDVNDLSMLKWAGHSVVMPHHTAEINGSADIVLDGDGVLPIAEYLKKVRSQPV